MESIQNPAAQFGSLRLFANHVVQSTPTLYKSIALADVRYCRFRQTRNTGLALLSTLFPSAAVGVFITTFGDGPLWTAAVWAALAAGGVVSAIAWYRLVTGVMTIRGRSGFMVEIVPVRRTTPRAARGFIDSLMRLRGELAVTGPAEADTRPAAADTDVVFERPAHQSTVEIRTSAHSVATPAVTAEVTRPIGGVV